MEAPDGASAVFLESSPESKLSAVDSKPTSTTSWHSFNPLENRFTEKCGKSLFGPFVCPELIAKYLRMVLTKK